MPKEIVMPGIEDIYGPIVDRRPTMLFLDDRSERLHRALEQYDRVFKVTLVATAKECIRLLNFRDWDVVSLDHDLDGGDFQDPGSSTSGMAVVRYLESTCWPDNKPKPRFYVHSSNKFAACAMVIRLNKLGLLAEWHPFGWSKYQNGVVAGAFDVIHPGYVRLLADAKEQCHILTVLIHDKPDQIFPIYVRKELLLALKNVDSILVYKTELELTEILSSGKYDVRFVGSDHKDKTTRSDLEIETVYHERNHRWSATKYKKTIFDFMKDM